MNKGLEKQAFEIGYREAEKHDSLIVPAHSKEMMGFISKHSKMAGDSIPWLKAFNAGQAKWFGDDFRRVFSAAN